MIILPILFFKVSCYIKAWCIINIIRIYERKAVIISEQILEDLKQPIAADKFAGSYIKVDRQIFRPLRNLYNEANSAARKLIQTPDENELDQLEEANIEAQKKLAQALVNCFKTQTKDIELLSWLMVSQVYLDKSLLGFKNTVSLLKFLVLEHWEELNPNVPELSLKSQDEVGRKKEITEFKAQSFNQMIGTGDSDSILYAPLSMLPLIDDITYFKYQSAQKKGECPTLKQNVKKYVEDNKVNLQALIETLKSCKNDFTEIYKYLSKVCAESNVTLPNFSFTINQFDKMLKFVSFITDLSIEDKANEIIAPTKESEEIVVKEQDVQEVSNQKLSTKVVSTTAVGGIENNEETFNLLAKNNQLNREQIFTELQLIADYFKSSEPHSPVSYLIEKAIRWGHMSLPELMNELMNEEQDTKNRIFTVAGLNDGSSNEAISGGNVTKTNNSSNNNQTQPSINW